MRSVGGGSAVRRRRATPRAVIWAVLALMAAMASAPPVTTTPSRTTTSVAGVPVPKRSPMRDFDAFAFTFSISVAGQASGAIQSSGSYVGPSRQDCFTRVVFGAHVTSERVVFIGNRVWLDTGDGFKVGTRPDAKYLAFCASDAAFWTAIADVDVPVGLAGVASKVDGIRAHRFEFGTDPAALPWVDAIMGGLPAGVTVDEARIWLADKAQWVVAMKIVLSATPLACEGLEQGQGVTFAGPCTMIVTFGISRANDTKLAVKQPTIR